MKYIRIILIAITIPLFLTSCWDSRLLKDHSLILAIGYDLNDDETMSKTVTFPHESESLSKEENKASSETITTRGNTVGDSDIDLERRLAQKFDRSKARVLLIGEKLAEYGIFPTLDSMYRDPLGPLNASVAIVEKTAKEGLEIKEDQSFLKSSFYFDLLKSAEDNGVIKRGNVQSVCPVLLSGRKDITLPLIKVGEKQNAYIKGLALFSSDQMTGSLDEDESIMALILLNEIKHKLQMNLKITDAHKEFEKNFVTFSVLKEKRKLTVSEKDERISANFHINLQLEVEEFAQDHLYNEGKVQELENKIEKSLQELANKTIAKTQQANSDIFGIGEKVQAFHHDSWEKLNWKETYPEVEFQTDLDVEIIYHGIIN